MSGTHSAEGVGSGSIQRCPVSGMSASCPVPLSPQSLGFVALGLVPGFPTKTENPENLLRLIFTLRVSFILQGYFWRPSDKTL